MIVRRGSTRDEALFSSLADRNGGASRLRGAPGTVDWAAEVERGLLSVVCEMPRRGGGGNELVGALVLNDHPRFDADCARFLDWFCDACGDPSFAANSTLFAELLVLDPQRDVEAVLSAMLASAYGTLPEISRVLLLVASGDSVPQGAPSCFEPRDLRPGALVGAEGSKDALAQAYLRGCAAAYVSGREALLPTLSVRRAEVEDHDDLAPIFSAQAELLAERYGEFFLAEMIEAQDEQNVALVGCARGRAVGLMALSSCVEHEVLQQCFDASAYDYFVKLPPHLRRQLAAAQDARAELVAREAGVAGGAGEGGGKEEEYAAALLAAEDEVSRTRAEMPGFVVVGPRGHHAERLARGVADARGMALVTVESACRFAIESGTETGQQIAKTSLDTAPSDLLMGAVLERVEAMPAGGQWLCALDIGALLGAPGATADETAAATKAFAQLLQRSVLLVAQAPRQGPADASPGGADGLFSSSQDAYARAAAVLRALLGGGGGGGDDVDGVGGSDVDGVGGSDGGRAAEAAGGVLLPEGVHRQCVVLPAADLSVADAAEALSALRSAAAEAARAAVLKVEQLRAEQKIRAATIGSAAEYAAAMAAIEASIAEDPARLSPNAFAVTLVCVDGAFESRLADMLGEAFAAFPDREYCLLMLPPDAAEGHPSLLRHMVRVERRRGSPFGHVLYCCHRLSLLAAGGQLRVERLQAGSPAAAKYDIAPLVRSVPDAAVRRRLQSALQAAAERRGGTAVDGGPSEVVFVGAVADEAVALLSVSREGCSDEELARLRDDYEVDRIVAFDRHRSEGQANLDLCVVRAAFNTRFSLGFFTREAMRALDGSLLYHRRDATAAGAAGSAFLPTAMLQLFTPVAPKSDCSARSALHCLPRKRACEPRTAVNARIVLVGCSAASLGCLRELLFTRHLFFTHLTLIDPCATAALDPSREAATGVHGDEPSARELGCLGLADRVEAVDDRVAAIDRDAKAVILASDGAAVPYDLLLLAPGLRDTTLRHLDGPGAAARAAAAGCFSGAAGAEALVEAHSRGELAGRVVVYGASLRALAGVERLLDGGVPGRSILLVRPGAGAVGAAEDGACLVEREAERLACSALADAGVESRSDLELADVAAPGGALSECVFERLAAAAGGGALGTVRVTCAALLALGSEGIDATLHAAINEARLVFDGKLVVGCDFRTCDADIYGAGAAARFSRVHRQAAALERCNGMEGGALLAASVLQRVDPPEGASDGALGLGLGLRPPPPPPEAPPAFARPRSERCRLPGGATFLRCSMPRRALKERQLGTGLAGGGAAKICVDEAGRVTEFAYCGTDPLPDGSRISRVVGLHEAVLNGALRRYDAGEIVCWVAYFREPWCEAVLHGGFAALLHALRTALSEDGSARAVADAALHALREGASDAAVAAESRRLVGKGGGQLAEGTRRMVEAMTIAHLRANGRSLQAYALPEGA